MGGFRGEHAWGVLAAAVAVYEFACREDELLSVAVDRWLESRPVLTRLIIGAVSLHLLNVLPFYADPLAKRFWRGLRRTLSVVPGCAPRRPRRSFHGWFWRGFA